MSFTAAGAGLRSGFVTERCWRIDVGGQWAGGDPAGWDARKALPCQSAIKVGRGRWGEVGRLLPGTWVGTGPPMAGGCWAIASASPVLFCCLSVFHKSLAYLDFFSGYLNGDTRVFWLLLFLSCPTWGGGGRARGGCLRCLPACRGEATTNNTLLLLKKTINTSWPGPAALSQAGSAAAAWCCRQARAGPRPQRGRGPAPRCSARARRCRRAPPGGGGRVSPVGCRCRSVRPSVRGKSRPLKR